MPSVILSLHNWKLSQPEEEKGCTISWTLGMVPSLTPINYHPLVVSCCFYAAFVEWWVIIESVRREIREGFFSYNNPLSSISCFMMVLWTFCWMISDHSKCEKGNFWLEDGSPCWVSISKKKCSIGMHPLIWGVCSILFHMRL